MMLKASQLHLAPFKFSIETDIPEVIANLKTLYPTAVFEQSGEQQFCDYRLKLQNAGGIRQFIKKQARFLSDYREPFKPLNYSQAYAMLEWGMNWTVAAHEMDYVIVHSAVLAKDGKAILFPAPPGSGKSTLTSYLAFNGWQLLSDEMALIQPLTKTVIPFVRPICLKNKSIELAKQWFPDGRFSTIARDTHKGDVIHLSPPRQSWEMASQVAEIVGVVFPNFKADQQLQIYQLNKRETFLQFAENAFNFTVLGERGFNTLTTIIEHSACFEIFHNNLQDVKEFLEEDVIQRA